MTKNYPAMFVATLSLTAFSATANTVDYNTWQKATKGDSLIVLNVNQDQSVLSVNCQEGKYTWVSLETRIGTVTYPDPSGAHDPEAIPLELLVTTKDGELVRWTSDDLNFNKPGAAGKQRVSVLFDTLHSAKKIDALLNGEMVIPFKGDPAKAFPEFKDVAKYCKA